MAAGMKTMRHQTPILSRARPPLRHERGITMILVLLLLIIAVAASAFFNNSMVNSTRISGANRDNSASLLLAESAMETLRGRLLNEMDDDYGGESDSCDDSCEIHEIVLEGYLASSTDVLSMLTEADYVFFAGNGTSGISEFRPSVLQKVANGEAAMLGSGTRVTSQEVASSMDEILCQDLFTGGTPMLFTTGPGMDWAGSATTNTNHLLVASAYASWDEQQAGNDFNKTIAAAWTEITLNPADSNAMDVWVQAIAQVGWSKSYLQRYIGTYYPASASTALSDIGVLIEAANFDRRVQP